MGTRMRRSETRTPLGAGTLGCQIWAQITVLLFALALVFAGAPTLVLADHGTAIGAKMTEQHRRESAESVRVNGQLWEPAAKSAVAGDSARSKVDEWPLQPREWAAPIASQYADIQFPPPLAGRARRLAEQTDGLFEEVGTSLGIIPARRYIIRLTDSSESFNLAQPGHAPDWAAGTAYPDRGLIVLKTRTLQAVTDHELLKTLKHEIVHILLGEAFGKHMVPLWLNEGLARHLAEEFSVQEWTVLTQAVVLNNIIALEELERQFPVSSERAELAYSQSRDFINYLTRRFGNDIIPRLVEQFLQGKSLNEALWSEVRHGLVGLEEDWRVELHDQYSWVRFVFNELTLWILASVLLFVAFVRRKAASQKRRLRWEQEEKLVWGEDLPVEIPGGEPSRVPDPAFTEGLTTTRELSPAGAEPDGESFPYDEEHSNHEPYGLPPGFPSIFDIPAMGNAFQKRSSAQNEDDEPPPGGWLH